MRFTLAALALFTAAWSAPTDAATSFPVAHTRARNVDMVLVKVAPNFFTVDSRTQERWYTDLQACVRRVNMAGTVVAVGHGAQGGFRFYGPKTWHDFLRSIDMAWVNQILPRLQASRFAAQRPGAGYPASGRAWTQDGLPRKIEIVERDDSGDVVSEFYYAEGALVFVFESVRGWRGTPARQVTVGEERLYYRDGRLVKWLSGMGSDKTDHTPGGADFNEAGRTRLAASAAFVAAARKALDVKR